MFELSLLVPQAEVETICDALIALDALSVSVEDADEGTEFEQARFGEPGMLISEGAWARSRLKSLFADAGHAEHAQRILFLQDFFVQCHIECLVEVPDQDWVRLTQSQFEPVAVKPDFWVVPTWHDVPQSARIHIRLDPGLAFGTGTHPTTRMCLEWMAEQVNVPHKALDYGCGSGILAIAAAKLGVKMVDAVDIDPSAVESTLANALANEVRLQVGLPDQVAGPYPWVIANILASPLKVLAPLLCQLTQSHEASLVLSGVLARQADEVCEAYAPWIDLRINREREGWVLLTGQR